MNQPNAPPRGRRKRKCPMLRRQALHGARSPELSRGNEDIIPHSLRKVKRKEKEKLTNIEKETVILFNEQEQTARIETFNVRLLNQLRRASGATEAVICEERGDRYGVYTVPKALVKIHVPRKLSDEERAKIVQQFKLGKQRKRENQF